MIWDWVWIGFMMFFCFFIICYRIMFLSVLGGLGIINFILKNYYMIIKICWKDEIKIGFIVFIYGWSCVC